MVTQSEIQYPRLRGEKKFQDFCLKLARRYWNDPYAQLHGRQGQAQHGVDITGEDKINNLHPVAMQAKGSESNNPRKFDDGDLVKEVEKAKTFKPKLELLIVAYNGERDQVLQKKAIDITSQHQSEGLFKVVVWAWDDIISEALNFHDVMEELILENKFPVAGHLDPARPRGDLAGPLQKIQAALAEAQAAYLDVSGAAPNDDPVSNAKIDVWKDQIVAGDGVGVVKSLRTFIEGLPGDGSARVRFRAYANLGSALIQAGDNDAAVEAFEKAIAADPGTADAHAYAARVALFKDDRVLALAEAEQALAIDPSLKLAAAILADTAPADMNPAGIEARVGALICEFDVGWAVSRLYAVRGDYDNALRVARLIEANEVNWARGVAIADAILVRFQDDFAMRLGAPAAPETKRLLDEARDALDAVWTTIKTRGDRANWAFVANNLASTFNLLGDEESADTLSLEAYLLTPNFPSFRQRATLAYIHKGETRKAIDLANEVATNGDAEDHLFAASIRVLGKEWAGVRCAAQAAFDKAADESTKSRAAELIIISELHLNGAEQASEKVQALQGEFPANVGFEARATEIARRLGDEGRLAAARNRLAQFDQDKLTPIERFELSDAYADDGQYGKAADLLDGLHDLDRPSVILKRRLFALYRAERRADARALYESLAGKALESIELLRLGAAIYERSGLLPNALTALDRAIALDSSDLRSRLDWCRLSLRSGDETRVSKWIKKADRDLAGEPEDVLEFAQLLHRYGRHLDALHIAYDVLRKHWGESERLHTMFMSLFLGPPNESDVALHPTEVAEDTVVFLENGHGAKINYRIEKNVEAGTDVLAPDNAFAQALIGAKLGDKRDSPAGAGQAATWTVKEIKHKYLDLFHRAMESHTTVFPSSRALGTFHIEPEKEGGFEPIFEQVRARAKLADEMGEFYQTNVIPIDAVARALGLDPIDASLGLRGSLNIRLDTCVGVEDERRTALQHLTGSESVMVDPLTLAIWNEIGLLEFLAVPSAPKIEMTQSTIDVISARALEAADAVGRGGGSLEARGEQVGLRESTEEEQKQTAKLWSDLATWCYDHATIVPTEVSDALRGEFKQLLSHASIDTLATAAAGQRRFVCDDRRLRLVGHTIGATRSGWTQPFLATLVAARTLSRKQYVQMCGDLSRRQIGFVSVSANDLVEACAVNSETFHALADALTHPKVESQSLLRVMAEFAAELWSHSAFVGARDGLIGAISDLLLRREDGLQLWVGFAQVTYRAIQRLDRPQNLLAKLWDDYVTRFARGHFLDESLKKLR